MDGHAHRLAEVQRVPEHGHAGLHRLLRLRQVGAADLDQAIGAGDAEMHVAAGGELEEFEEAVRQLDRQAAQRHRLEQPVLSDHERGQRGSGFPQEVQPGVSLT